MCDHTKISLECSPYESLWCASCDDCADGDCVGDPPRMVRCGGVYGSGRTKLAALKELRDDILGDDDESPATATVDTLIAEQEMLAAADRMAAKSAEVLAAFRGAAQ